MISEPVVTVTCDLCRLEIEVHMHSHTDAFDMHAVRAELRRMRWEVEHGSDETLCPDCTADEREARELRRSVPTRKGRGR